MRPLTLNFPRFLTIDGLVLKFKIDEVFLNLTKTQICESICVLLALRGLVYFNYKRLLC